METFLAFALPLLALFALGYVYLHSLSSVTHAIATYVAFALVFGCVHFLIYRHNPALYVVSKDVPNAAAVESLRGGEKRFDLLLDRIAFTDAVLLRLNESVPKSEVRLAVSDADKDYREVAPGLDLTTRAHETLVGGRQNPPIPVYSILARATFTADFRGQKAGTNLEFSLPSSDSDRPDTTFTLADLSRSLQAHRKELLASLVEAYERDSTRPALFKLPDFFYFAFSMTGVGEVIPIHTGVRLLVLLQFLLSVILPIAMPIWAAHRP